MSEYRSRAGTRLLSGIRSDALIVGLLVIGVTAVYTGYALGVASFQNDEEMYTQLARYMAGRFPHVLWQSGIYPRGTQRLDPAVLALGFALGRGASAYQIDRMLQCLLFASTAVPVFLLARGAGLPRPTNLFAAALAVVVPWAVVSTSFLAESAAYPAYAWVLLATFALLRRPTLARELLVLVALAVGALSRTALLALAPLPALAVLWHEWSWGLAGRPWRSRAHELPRRLTARYRLLSAAAAVGIAVYLADRIGLLPGRGLASLAGDYGIPRFGSLSALFDLYRLYLSRMTAGTGFLAVALGLPWAALTLIRPRDGARHALAVVCTLGVAAVLLSLLKGGPDERYVMYGAIPISLTAAAALAWIAAHAPRPGARVLAAALLGAIAVVLLIDSVTWPQVTNAYDYFTYPAAVFYVQPLGHHLVSLRPPGVHLGTTGLIELCILLATGAWLTAWRWLLPGRVVATLLGLTLLLASGAQDVYALHKFTVGAGEANGGTTARERSWVDEHVPAGARVARLGISEGEIPTYFPIWRVVTFWNTSVNTDVFTDAADPMPFFLGDRALQLAFDPDSGRAHLIEFGEAGKRPLPGSALRYLLVPRQGTNRLAVDGAVVGQHPYLPLTLIRPSQPLRLDWQLTGTSAEAFATSDQPVTATVYPAALHRPGRLCATFALIAAPHFSGQWSFGVSVDGKAVRRGSLLSQQTLTLTVPLPRRHEASPAIVTRVHGQAPYGGQMLSARFANFAVVPCPAR